MSHTIPARDPAEARPSDPRLRTPADRRWDRIRLVLVVGWLVLAATTAVTGERSASWNEVQHEGLRLPATEATLVGWHVPSALAWPLILLAVGSVVVLVAGPGPWRATRWAWFWLMSLPVGSFAFLLLSGPTPGLPRPRDPRRRLIGGWAFLLALPLEAVLGSWGVG